MYVTAPLPCLHNLIYHKVQQWTDGGSKPAGETNDNKLKDVHGSEVCHLY